MTAQSSRVAAEDLRPRSLDEIIGQDSVISRLRRILEGVRNGSVHPPSLLLHGVPGIGKTTAARAFARDALGEFFEVNFTELKAFDDRILNRLSGIIMESRQPPKRGGPFRVLFVDEVETLSPDAQNALRPAMEGEGGASVYILATNELGTISKALQSRCTVLEFKPITPTSMRSILRSALAKTPFNMDALSIDSIVEQSNGIPREAIKLLLEEVGARQGLR